MLGKASGILHPVAKGRGGVAVSHNKNTKDCEVVRMPAPQTVVLPMQQHIGAPCEPVVRVGDKVAVGQLIGDTDKFVSTPIHASISGTVISVAPAKIANGRIVPAVTIESDGEMRRFEGIEPPKINNREDFLAAVRASGLVGLGGAGFPSHVKLNYPPEKNVDTLIINAAECEPYITVDYRECIDNSWDILTSIHLLKQYLGIKNVIIAVEDNKPEAVTELQKIANQKADTDNSVKVMVLPSRYPQGAEKVMVLSATGRKVPPGKLPADVGCVLMNVASTAFIARYLKTGRPLVSRSLTVDGSAIAEPKNVRVPIGTCIDDIISFCGGFKSQPFKVIAGGPMMGISLVSTNVPILKNNNAILAFAEGSARIKPEHDCIRCGRCSQACPMSLTPTNIMRYVKANDAEKLRKESITVCMECGSCSYACPAGKPLVQYMVFAKNIIREADSKK